MFEAKLKVACVQSQNVYSSLSNVSKLIFNNMLKHDLHSGENKTTRH